MYEFLSVSWGGKKAYLLVENASGSNGTIKYNISSLVKEYTSLTKDNILIVPKTVYLTFLGGRHNAGQWYSASADISYSYDPSNGQISVSGSASVGGGDNSAYLTSVDIWIIPT